LRLEYEAQAHWPPLAWLARCDGDLVHIQHGSDVEVRADWFGEIAWDGPFKDAGFDLTDIVTGSGARLRGKEMIFVPAGSTVDRLQFWKDGNRVFLSNSLPCLLAAADAEIALAYPQYFEDFKTVVRGLGALKDTLETTRGAVRFGYFDNLVWNGATLEVRAKPCADRQFPDFESYRLFLTKSMAAMVENLSDAARSLPFSPIATLSSGYDSSAVAVLAHAAGTRDAITFHTSRQGDDDRGSALAAALDLNVHTFDREAWRNRPFVEIPFIAGNAHGQDVALSGAEELLKGRVVFTGYYGDSMWKKDRKDLGPTILRKDASGLSLTEYRLWAGFLHAPVPFWGTRQVRQINAISNSPEMKAWDVPGNYSRPVARRIVEETGVERTAFGIAKRAVSVLMWDPANEFMLTPPSFEDYRRHLTTGASAWLRLGRLPPQLKAPFDRGAELLRRRLESAPRPVRGLVRRLPLPEWLTKKRKGALFRHLFPWAIERAKTRYRPPAPAD
jgi:hypothetical protein